MRVRAVTFSGGGEPLLYPDIASVVQQLAAGGVRVATLTNGACLSGAVAHAFAEHGTQLRISTDDWDDQSCSICAAHTRVHSFASWRTFALLLRVRAGAPSASHMS